MAAERAQILATFERSRLSAAAFARQHGLNYTSFSGWWRRQTKAPASPEFVQIEVATPSAPTELTPSAQNERSN
jgi:transposase-like protein